MPAADWKEARNSDSGVQPAGRPGGLPNLVIIGAMKCGTSSLHYYLSLHPQISMSREKELDFFTHRRWHRGLAWYCSRFRSDARVRGESSTSYTDYPFMQSVPERMYAVIPDAKLIYLVRDPIERIVSHYIHNHAAGMESRVLADALADPDSNPYVTRSNYYMQLKQYLPYFSRDRILVIAQEELADRRNETMRNVFRFLEVDESFSSPKFWSCRNVSRSQRRKTRLGVLLERSGPEWLLRRIPAGRGRTLARSLFYYPFSRKIKRPVPTEALRRQLEPALREDVERLREFTGLGFEKWSL